jgi:hypothetical protein
MRETRSAKKIQQTPEFPPKEPVETPTKKVSKRSVKVKSSNALVESSFPAPVEPPFPVAVSSAVVDIIGSIDYCERYREDTYRQTVIVPTSGEQFWPAKNMAFFKSTGTSNKGCEWLRGTFFPTSGITCRKRDDETIYNYAECVKGDPNHFAGHITKMSDYTRLILPDLMNFMRDLFDGVLLPQMSRVFPLYPRTKITDEMLTYPSFGHGAFQYIDKLAEIISDYFLTEEQLKLSYQLTADNTGLWGFTFMTFSLSDFCRQRWGALPKFNVPNINIEQCASDTGDVYDFIVRNGANIEFDVMKIAVSSQINPDTNQKRRELQSRIAHCRSDVHFYELLLNRAKGINKAKSKKQKATKSKKKRAKSKKKK